MDRRATLSYFRNHAYPLVSTRQRLTADLLERRPSLVRLSDALVGISTANLLAIDLWAQLFSARGADAYYHLVPSVAYLSAVCVVLLVGIGLALAAIVYRAVQRPAIRFLCHVGFLGLLTVPVNHLRIRHTGLRVSELLELMMSPGTAISAAIAMTLVVYAIYRWHRHLAWFQYKALLALSPFLAFTVGQSLWHGTHSQATPSVASTQSDVDSGHTQRLILVVFDELDSDITFDHRPTGVALEHIDRLASESVLWPNARSSSPETMRAIPSLVTGRTVTRAKPIGPSELSIRFSGESSDVNWSETDTLFSTARQAGANVSIVGWYHPYCRIFRATVTNCAWTPHVSVAAEPGASFVRHMARQIATFSPFGRRRHHIEATKFVRQRALEVVSDPEIDLVFIHWPVPHAPWIYNAQSRAFSVTALGPSGYLANLELADALLGDIRSALERSERGEETALIVTSDHPLRTIPPGWTAGARIPFLVKPAGPSAQGAVVTDPVDATLIYNLSLELLRGDVQTRADLVDWSAKLNGE